MRIKRIMTDAALCMGWLLVGVATALILMFLFAHAIDPTGNGPVGEGMIFASVFSLLLFTGMAFGSWRAWVTIRKRRSKISN
jgi:hypothetical protein